MRSRSHRNGVPFAVMHSAVAPDDLAALVARQYQIRSPIRCDYVKCGLNDTYSVRTGDQLYFLRVSRKGWRQTEDIKYELDVLAHLARRGVSVSTPIVRRDRKLHGHLQAAEGRRIFVLFSGAPGKEFTHTGDQPFRYGMAVAAIHNASDDFQTSRRRFKLDLEHLLEGPLSAVRRCLLHRPDDLKCVEDLGEAVRPRFAQLTSGRLDFGFCHGDTRGENAHIADDGTVTFFDFDCGGSGWRAYDLAIYRMGLMLTADDPKWTQFLDGYGSKRALSSRDFDAIALFFVLRQVWTLGIAASLSEQLFGRYFLDVYMDYAFERLRQWPQEITSAHRQAH